MNQDPNTPHAHVMGMKSGALRNRIAAQQMAQAIMNPQPQAAPAQTGQPVQPQTAYAPGMAPQVAVMAQPVGLMGLGATVMRPKRVY